MAEYTERSTDMEYAETDVDTVNISSLIQALERINTLVGPAKVEITTLAARQKSLHGSTAMAELQCQLEKTRGEKETLYKQFEANNQAYNAKCAELERKLQHAIEKFNELQTSAKKQEQLLIANHEEKIDAFKDVIQRTESELQGTVKEKEKALQSIDDLKVKAHNKIQQQKTENEQLKRSLTHFKAEKDRIEKDLSDTKTRLSKLMGDKLSDKNPDIADLSDDKRPTKLAEQYQELYDNEWTDAFEAAEEYFPGKEESFRIHELLKIFMKVYGFCEREFDNQEKELIQAIYRSNPHTTRQDLPDNVKAQLKEIKRLTATGAIDYLKKKYFEEVNKAENVEGFNVKVKIYVEECISLCWMMIRQDPPLVLHTNVEMGDQFDSSKYRPYTSTGQIVEFVVWPALFLHQDGPLLSKGVVQCINKFQGSKSVNVRSRQIDTKQSFVSSASMRLSTDTTNRFLDGNHNAKTKTQSEQTSKQKLKNPNTATVQQGDKTKFSKEKMEQQRNKYPSQGPNNQAQHMISKGDETNKGFGFNDPACSKQDKINETSASASLKHNQPTAGSHKPEQNGSENYAINLQTPSNHQQSKPAGSVLKTFDPLASQPTESPSGPSGTGMDQNQSSTVMYTSSNQQSSHSTNVSANASHDVNQQPSVPYNCQVNQVQYDAQLIPTQREYDTYVYYNNYHRHPDEARHYMGAQVYDKCKNYLIWLQSMQYNWK